MRTWIRACSVRRCGSCEQVIPVGSPVLLLTVHGTHGWTKARCGSQACAGEAAPDLPPLIEQLPLQKMKSSSMTPVRQLAGLALDWKSRQAGESREPGEEG